MERIARDRRIHRRYEVHLPLYYSVSQKGRPAQTGSGTTREMSTDGLSFRCRRQLPIGAHVEITIEWPARHDDAHPMDLHLTGFIIRSEAGRAAVRLTSHRFRVLDAPAEPYRATA